MGFSRTFWPRPRVRERPTPLRDSTSDLDAQRRAFNGAQRLARIGTWAWDAGAGEATWTPEMYKLFDRDPELGPATNQGLLEHIHPDDRERFASGYATTFGGRPGFELDYRIVLEGGRTRTLHGIGHRDPDRSGFYVGTVQDVTEQREAERELRSERDYAATITSSMHEGFMLTRDGRILEVNQALCRLTGFTREELVGARVPYPFWAPEAVEEILCQRDLIDEHGYDFETTYLRQDGARFDAAITSVAAFSAVGELIGYVSTVRDVSERKRHLAELERLATHDPLTGLANHRAFHERLRQEVARSRRNLEPLSLVVLDLDHFKAVNDRHGHTIGDSVLCELAQRLNTIAREDEMIARVGGEEFAWILNAPRPIAFAAAERARRAITETPFPRVGTVTISIGVCDLSSAKDADELYNCADRALYRAKGEGRNRTCECVHDLRPPFYEPVGSPVETGKLTVTTSPPVGWGRAVITPS